MSLIETKVKENEEIITEKRCGCHLVTWCSPGLPCPLCLCQAQLWRWSGNNWGRIVKGGEKTMSWLETSRPCQPHHTWWKRRAVPTWHFQAIERPVLLLDPVEVPQTQEVIPKPPTGATEWDPHQKWAARSFSLLLLTPELIVPFLKKHGYWENECSYSQWDDQKSLFI